MKILIIGVKGFLGRNVLQQIKTNTVHEVIAAGRSGVIDYVIDLSNFENIKQVVEDVQPEVIVNCAGIIANTDEANKNAVFCKNIFEAILSSGKPYPKVVVTGSAAEYGVVDDDNWPVSERTPLRAVSDYGKGKIEEENLALEYAKVHGIDVVVARIFNPIGPDMGEKFLLTSLLKQINDVRIGRASSITLSRLDSRRDYVDVRDVARAIEILALQKTEHEVYNIGSGVATTNGELLDVLLDTVELNTSPTIIESQDAPEPNYAAQADIHRIQSEMSWQPMIDLRTTVEDIVHAKSIR